MIGIIDYGMGNLRSVQRALETTGVACQRILRPEELSQCHGLVLPGVGAFAKAVQNLKRIELWDPLIAEVQAGKPLLGLCLGLQLLFQSSEEFGNHAGMGIFPGHIRRLPSYVSVPHIGWNQVFVQGQEPLFNGIPAGSHFYFLHSFVAESDDPSAVVAECRHGISFPAVVRKANIMAAQFHPEKSQRYGLRFLANYIQFVRNGQ